MAGWLRRWAITPPTNATETARAMSSMSGNSGMVPIVRGAAIRIDGSLPDGLFVQRLFRPVLRTGNNPEVPCSSAAGGEGCTRDFCKGELHMPAIDTGDTAWVLMSSAMVMLM